MKKLVIALTTAALALTTNAFAQSNLRFGVKGGLNLTHGKVESTPGLTEYNGFGPGFYAGGLAELSFPKGSKFKLQLEALYNMNFITFKSDMGLPDVKHTIHNVQKYLFLRVISSYLALA